ncbi:hypothetical protein [Pseudosulfitobacter koreensis]|uniref:Uncharacterized protein n=1 Tax=Pseudosulfitobacter koreensis TaxID=2968472 RepID=A0ABT1YYR7_9RHOB|nr:hypothetical protein [Pseudosulfitobacter koreense]MCR8826023.1 hypothetical protein [Pseudosulfitobacter koreense]
MGGRAEDAVYEARQVIMDLAGYLRAVKINLGDDSGVELDSLAQRLEVIARDCDPDTRLS